MNTLRTLKGYHQPRNDQGRVRSPEKGPAHIAYYLCYPFMVNQKERKILTGPRDHHYIYDSEAV